MITAHQAHQSIARMKYLFLHQALRAIMVATETLQAPAYLLVPLRAMVVDTEMTTTMSPSLRLLSLMMADMMATTTLVRSPRPSHGMVAMAVSQYPRPRSRTVITGIPTTASQRLHHRSPMAVITMLIQYQRPLSLLGEVMTTKSNV